MVKCLACGRDNPPRALFCRTCGRNLEEQQKLHEKIKDRQIQESRKAQVSQTQEWESILGGDVTKKLDKKRTLLPIIAVVIAVIVILASILVIASVQPGPKSLYATISVSHFLSYSVSNPTYKISVDRNGDGIFEIADSIIPMVSALDAFSYVQTGFSRVNAVIDGESSGWSFKVQVLNGSTPVHFDGSLDESIHVCNMSTEYSWFFFYEGNALYYGTYEDPFLGSIPNTCDLRFGYDLSSTPSPNQQYQ